MNSSSDDLRIFKALADENRVRMLELMQQNAALQACEGPDCDPEGACVTSMAETLGITTATASHHIKELLQAGLITTTKKGRWVYCRVNQDALYRAANFLKQLGKEET